MKALVYRSTGSWYDVKDESGKKWKARLKGAFRIDNITSTNPIAVGDWVNIEPEDGDQDFASISGIEDRRNQISRQSPQNKNLQHIVASNIDQSLLIATLKDPKTSQGFIDRFLVSAEAYHVPAILIFNKTDTWREKEKVIFHQRKMIYESIGYRVMTMSVTTGEGLEEIKSLLAGKTTLLSGHSGVGKSSFLNAIIPGLALHTHEVSGWSGKGMHTTTFAEMFELPDGGKLIDTPGIRELGIVHISRQELSHFFPEMRNLLNDCQFNNCMHLNEPGCAVKKAVAPVDDDFPMDGSAVSEERFLSYLNIMDTIEEKSW